MPIDCYWLPTHDVEQAAELLEIHDHATAHPHLRIAGVWHPLHRSGDNFWQPRLFDQQVGEFYKYSRPRISRLEWCAGLKVARGLFQNLKSYYSFQKFESANKNNAQLRYEQHPRQYSLGVRNQRCMRAMYGGGCAEADGNHVFVQVSHHRAQTGDHLGF